MSILVYGCLLLLAAYCILLLVYCAGWALQHEVRTPAGKLAEVKISVIIPARNEAVNIGKCLGSIAAQNYPKALFEVILIDDFSDDDTVAIASGFSEHLQLQILQLKDVLSSEERLNAYKKAALTYGIKASNGDLLITTDADCIASEGWLRNIAAYHSKYQAVAIIAPVSFSPVDNVCGLFQSLDFMTMQGITAASQKLGLGSMANGANFAFTRAVWDEIDGYTGSEGLASGDDYHLLHKIKARFPAGIHYLKNESAVIQTLPQPGWRSFLNQRIRWASKSGKYPDRMLTAILMLVYVFNVSILVLALASIFCYEGWPVLGLIMIIKVTAEVFLLLPVSIFFKKTRELLIFPFLQPLHILYIILAGFLGMAGSYEWKGRRVH